MVPISPARTVRIVRGLRVLSAILIGSGCGAFVVSPAAAESTGSLFTEITTELGLSGPPRTWPRGSYRLPEIMGGGVALFDYERDGDLDILEIRNPPPDQFEAPAPNRLFRQNQDGTFSEVSSAAALGDPGYGQGVALGDADNDGDLDVYVTNYGPDVFYRNNGDGTFDEATSAAGLLHDRWSTSAAFVDYDRDDDLDLYVVHYVQDDSDSPCSPQMASASQQLDIPDYCGPQEFEATIDSLFRNSGDGTFTEVTAEAGIAVAGRGLGVVALDLTGDGWADIWVANDREVNHLWVNRGDGTFVDEAVPRGVGFNIDGQPEASMGVAVGDADGDGRVDLLTTHLAGETNTLYLASVDGVFTDASKVLGLSAVDLPRTGFGCGFFDFDNDGDLDLAVVNGRVSRGPRRPGNSQLDFWSRYGERNLLFRNEAGIRFTDASATAGMLTGWSEVSRGLAFGDIDADGDLDLVEGTLAGIRVYRNDAPLPGNHWLLVRAVTSNRDAIGAQMTVVAGGKRLVRMVLPGYSYASSSDPRVHFGLGGASNVTEIEVLWPDGARESFAVPGVDRELTVHQGQGRKGVRDQPNAPISGPR
jgi:hypothetical protein